MRRRLLYVPFVIATVVTALYVGNVEATSSSGFTGTTIAVGRFEDIDVFNQLVLHHVDPRDANVWLSMQKTKGSSDAYVQSNVWQPGGHSGWHTHPGHSLIIVTAGEVTVYEGTCGSGVTYGVGRGFVDPGGDHVHLIANEGNVEARTVTFQVIPAGAQRRIDAPAPEDCH